MATVGYIVKDKAGVVAIFPDWANEEWHTAMCAENYARNNTILETVKMKIGEDEIEFKLRLNRLADNWRKKLKTQNVN